MNIEELIEKKDLTVDELVRNIISFINNSKEDIRIDASKLKIDHNTLFEPDYDPARKVNSDGGAIRGAKIKGGSIEIGSEDKIFKVDSNGIYLGSSKFTSAPFKVDMQGNVIANSITISGRSGKTLADAINVDGNLIKEVINEKLNTSTRKILKDFSLEGTNYAGALKAGTITWSTSTGEVTGGTGFVINDRGILGALNGVTKVAIKNDGTAYFAGQLASGISISSPVITGGSIAIGSGNAIFKADSNGIYLGSAIFGSAPFRVDMSGNLVATNATITGALTTGAGSNISGTYISNINAGTITVGTLPADRIAPGSIESTKLGTTVISGGKIVTSLLTADNIQTGTLNASVVNVTNLNASNITTGTLSANRIGASSITGDKIASSTITSDKISVSTLSAISANLGTVTAGKISLPNGGHFDIDENSINRVRLNVNGVIVRNTKGLFMEETTPGNYGSLSVNASNQLVAQMPSTNTFYIKNAAGTVNEFTLSSANGAYHHKGGFLIGSHFDSSGNAINPGRRIIRFTSSVPNLAAGTESSVYTFNYSTAGIANMPTATRAVFAQVETTGAPDIFVKVFNLQTTGWQWTAKNASSTTQSFTIHWLVVGD